MQRNELYIGGVKVDLKNDLQTYLNFRRSDIQRPDTKQWDFSYDIIVPGTKSTDKLFGFLFEIRKQISTSGDTNFQPDFNPNLKAECVYLKDSIEQFRGVANLKKITIREDREVEYSVVLYGKFKDIINAFGDDELADIIDISEYDHAYTLANIVDSWSVQIQRFGLPYANFQGTPTTDFPNGKPSGEGYVYPLIDYGFTPNLQDFNLINLYPSIYDKTIWDKIFAYYGFTYGSTFLNSAEFKTVIQPYNSPFLRLNAAQVLARKFYATKTTNTQLTVSVGVGNSQNATIVFNDDSNPPNFDSSSQYNNANGQFTVGTGLEGIHSFTTKVILTGQWTPDTPGVSVKTLNHIRAFVQLVKSDANNVITVLNSALLDIDHTDFFTTNYETTNPGSVSPLDLDYSASPFNPRNHVSLSATNVNMAATDRIIVRVTYYALPNAYGNLINHTVSQLFYDGSANFYGGNIYLNVKLDSIFYNNIDNTQIIEGQTVLMNNCLPQKVKVKDWFMSVVKKFNLQIEPDKEIPNKLNIETYDDYYNDTVLDWSKKVDISQPMAIIPMGALDAKRYVFKDKDDTDYYNQRYRDTMKRSYGEREISVINDFVTQIRLTETIFSPTPSVGNDSNNMVIPRIIKVDAQNTVTNHEANVRILYYGGLKTSNAIWNIIDSNGANTYGKYPYAGHLDDPFNPTMDLNFGIPFEIYWKPLFSNIVWSNNNAYNRFWKRDIEERIDRNSKIVEVMMRLKPTDILNINFRKTYFFKDEYFRLLNIVDYNPSTESLTKCIFIRRKEAVPFVADTGTFDDTLAEIGGDETLPSSISSGIFNDNTGSSTDQVVIGTGNRIASTARNIYITGENNRVGEFSKEVNMFSCSGCTVFSGVKNVTMVNTYGKRVLEDNHFIVNGQSISGEPSIAVITYTGAKIVRDNDETATFHEVDCTGGAITVELENPAKWTGMVRYFKKMDSTANAMTVEAFGSAKIDGSASVSTTTQNVCFGIYSDGSNYRIVTTHN